MKKLVLGAAALLMCCSLFFCVQPASAAVVTDYDGAWTEASSSDQVFIEISGTLGTGQGFGYYTGTFDASSVTSLLVGDNQYVSFKVTNIAEDSWKFYFYDSSLSDPYLTLYDYEAQGSPGHYELEAGGMKITVLNAVPTPIPTAALLLGTGLVGLVGFRRRFNK